MPNSKRLTSLGNINYRNIGLSFAIGVLMEMRKELCSTSRQCRDIATAEQALSVVLKNLPDEMTAEQVEISCQIFLEMEKAILRYGVEYFSIMSPLDREDLYNLIAESECNCGTDYV